MYHFYKQLAKSKALNPFFSQMQQKSFQMAVLEQGRNAKKYITSSEPQLWHSSQLQLFVFSEYIAESQPSHQSRPAKFKQNIANLKPKNNSMQNTNAFNDLQLERPISTAIQDRGQMYTNYLQNLQT